MRNANNSPGPDIRVGYFDSFPSSYFSEFIQQVSADGLTISDEPIEARFGAPYAAMELLIPTAVTILIAKSYFDGFLKEAGKDHYHALKFALATLGKRLGTTKWALVSSKGEVKRDKPYSLLFSVISRLDNGVTVKFLVRGDYSEADYTASIDAYLDLLQQLHVGPIGADLSSQLAQAPITGNTLLVSYDNVTGRIDFVDPLPAGVRRNLSHDE